MWVVKDKWRLCQTLVYISVYLLLVSSTYFGLLQRFSLLEPDIVSLCCGQWIEDVFVVIFGLSDITFLLRIGFTH